MEADLLQAIALMSVCKRVGDNVNLMDFSTPAIRKSCRRIVESHSVGLFPSSYRPGGTSRGQTCVPTCRAYSIGELEGNPDISAAADASYNTC